MTKITVEDLRTRSAELVDRASRGEQMTIMRDGEGVAQLRELPRAPMPAEKLLARYRRLPPIDAGKLRADLDRVIDPRI
jgi:antitoxin (DNA-binding transcriptional repressor) of toxin-antitoxin stability system